MLGTEMKVTFTGPDFASTGFYIQSCVGSNEDESFTLSIGKPLSRLSIELIVNFLGSGPFYMDPFTKPLLHLRGPFYIGLDPFAYFLIF